MKIKHKYLSEIYRKMLLQQIFNKHSNKFLQLKNYNLFPQLVVVKTIY